MYENLQDILEEICNCVNIDLSAGAKNNKCKFCNLDVARGFQDVSPMFLSVIVELISNVVSQNIPSNVANAIGNWLQMISTEMTLYIGQQQYQESGPGRLYNPAYRNISNPFCNNATSDKLNYKKEIKELNRSIRDLKVQIKDMREEINRLKK